MKWRMWRAASAIALSVTGCATTPTPIMPADAPLTPLIESPPMEPAESPLPLPAPPPASASPTARSEPASQPPAASTAVVIGPPASSEPTEDQQMLSLLADLQRYGTLQNDELKRELTAASQALGRQRTDVNRVRLAVLYTLLRASPQGHPVDRPPVDRAPQHIDAGPSGGGAGQQPLMAS